MQNTTSTRLYQSIYKLPISKFQDCLCDGDLTALAITGTLTEQELTDAWESILDQYEIAISGLQHQHYIKLAASVERLQIKINLSYSLISLLSEMYVERLAAHLGQLLNVKLKLDIGQLDAYDKTLNNCLSRLKGMEIELERKVIELQAIEKKMANSNIKPSRETFQKSLINLSDHAKHELDENTLTVYSYCERIKRYNAYIERLHSK